MADDSLRPSTIAVTTGRPPNDVDQPLNTPITMASTYVAGGDREYGRYGNPTWQAFEEVLGELEGGRALSFSSGLAAVSVVLDLAPGEELEFELSGRFNLTPDSRRAMKNLPGLVVEDV